MHYRHRQIVYDYSFIDDMNKESDVEESDSSDCDSDSEYETSENIETKTSNTTKVKVSSIEKCCKNYRKYIDEIELTEEGVHFALFIIGGVLIIFNLFFT